MSLKSTIFNKIGEPIKKIAENIKDVRMNEKKRFGDSLNINQLIKSRKEKRKARKNVENLHYKRTERKL